MFKAKHTFKSVAKELVEGLESGTIMLGERASQKVAIRLSKQHDDVIVTFGFLRWENGFLAGLAQQETQLSQPAG